MNWRKIGVLFSITALSVFASLTEVLQMLVAGRTPSLHDFFVDVIAAAIGLVAGMAILAVKLIATAWWLIKNLVRL